MARRAARLRSLNRQIFSTYGGHVFCTNLAFALLATLPPGWLLDGSPLAAAVAGFICLYWHLGRGVLWILAGLGCVAVASFIWAHTASPTLATPTLLVGLSLAGENDGARAF